MWIPFDEALFHEPSVIVLAERLGIGIPAAAGYICTVALECFKNNTPTVSPETFEISARWGGAQGALLQNAIGAQILVEEEGALRLSPRIWSLTGGRYEEKRKKRLARLQTNQTPKEVKPEPIRSALYERAGIASDKARERLDQFPLELIAAWVAYVEHINTVRHSKPLGPGLIVCSVASGAWPPDGHHWQEKGLAILDRLNGNEEGPFVLE